MIIPHESRITHLEEPGNLNRQAESTGAVCIERLDDTSLMKLLALHQSDALGDLYDRYGRLVYSIALNSVGDWAVAEEIVQDVFTRVWEKANTYDARIAKLSTWLVRITRNRAIDELRRYKVRSRITCVSWSAVSKDDTPTSQGPEEETEVLWKQKLIIEALETLSPNEREALALAYFKGYSHSEIAEVLGIPLGTVKTRIRVAMQKLRLVLDQTMLEDQ